MKRREFIDICSKSCIAYACIPAFLSSCSTSKYIHVNAQGNSLRIPLNSFMLDKNGFRKYIIAKSDASEFPIIVLRSNEEEYSSFLLRCTHKGYELNVSGDLLHCSAHGSEFNLKGEVMQGPAGKPLMQYKTEVQGDHLMISLT